MPGTTTSSSTFATPATPDDMTKLKTAKVRINLCCTNDPESLKDLYAVGCRFRVTDDVATMVRTAERLGIPPPQPIFRDGDPPKVNWSQRYVSIWTLAALVLVAIPGSVEADDTIVEDLGVAVRAVVFGNSQASLPPAPRAEKECSACRTTLRPVGR
ncbi:MAG: hypothetical protein M5U29_04630 [Anaerolineae bacterium]|nr:hypothetical protein [Anaerolineae bacterium]